MNTRHPVNPALKEEGGARTAHGLERRSCDACVSSLAGSSRENPGKRDGRREQLEGRKLAAKHKGRSRAWGGGAGLREEPGVLGETPGGGSSRSPHPRRCPGAGCGVAPAPLTKTVPFRLVSVFLFHLSDSIMPPL